MIATTGWVFNSMRVIQKPIYNSGSRVLTLPRNWLRELGLEGDVEACLFVYQNSNGDLLLSRRFPLRLNEGADNV